MLYVNSLEISDSVEIKVLFNGGKIFTFRYILNARFIIGQFYFAIYL